MKHIKNFLMLTPQCMSQSTAFIASKLDNRFKFPEIEQIKNQNFGDHKVIAHDPLISTPANRNRILIALMKQQDGHDENSDPRYETTKKPKKHPSPDIQVRSPYSLTASGKKIREFVKGFLYSQVGVSRAIGTLFGKQDPYIEFVVESDPPSIFINYKLKHDTIDAFKEAIELPDSIPLLPVTCIEHGEPEYLISLNAYRVSGITEGLRAEWSTYIDRGDGKPSYLVFDGITSKISMDPVHILTMPSKIDYTNEDQSLTLTIEGRDGDYFSFCAPEIDDSNSKEVISDRDWIAANDYIFWTNGEKGGTKEGRNLANGICDRVFYDGALIATPMKKIDLSNIEVINQNKWRQYVEEEPCEFIALSKPAKFVISPWFNIGDDLN